MRASAHVGRVGGLALALGIGFAVNLNVAATAWAGPTDAATRSDGDVATNAASSTAHQLRVRGGRGVAVSTAAAGGATASAPANNSNLVAKMPTSSHAISHPAVSTRSVGLRMSAAPTSVAEGSVADQSRTAAVGLAPALAVPASIDPATVAQSSVASAGLDSVRLFLPRGNPLAPVGDAVSWTVLSAARRPTAGKVSAATAKPTASATNADPIAALFFNATPTFSWTVNAVQGSNGEVTGTFNSSDAEGDQLSFSVTAAPAGGTVAVSADGSYSYTPSQSAAFDGTTDSFTVSASDAGSGFHIHGIGGLLNLLTFGLFGSSGHTTTATVAVDVPPWRRGPTATVTVGVPDPTTGSVLGQVIGVAGDGGALVYSAPAMTDKGSVIMNAGTGAFTYTPMTSARGTVVGADTFTALVTDDYGGSTPIVISVPVAAWVATNPMVTFAFNYTSGSQHWSVEAVNALQFAANKVASYITVTQPVALTFDITAEVAPELIYLASASSDLGGWGTGFFRTVVQDKVISGVDRNGSAADGVINVNFAAQWSYSDTVSSSEYDLASVLMHEMLHTYGFTTNIRGPNDTTNGSTWSIFDACISDSNASLLINRDSYQLKTALNANLTGGNGGLYFAGVNAVAAYGRVVPLYTTDTWTASSLAHLDDDTFQGANTQRMNAMTDTGPGIRTLSSIEQGILMDLGYTIRNQMSASILFFGLLLIRRRRVPHGESAEE